MAVAAMKHMASNFAKLDKFKRVNFWRWQKKMHFLLSGMSIVYVLTTLIAEDGENATMEQIRRRNKLDNDDYVCRGLILNVVRLLDPKLKTLGESGIECIFVGYAEHSKAFRLSSVPRLILMIPNRTEGIGGLVVPEKVTEEVVTQQPEPDHRKRKRKKTLKNFRPEFQLYLIKGKRDEVSNQQSYCFKVEDDPKTFNEAMKSQDAMTCTWPDIAFAVGKLSRYTSNHVLEGYTDASWISNKEKNSFISGWVFLLGGAGGKKAELLRNLILEIPLWSKPIAPISILCDSVATLAKAYSQMYNGKSRHLGVRHNMIHELIMNEVASIEFVTSQQNLADQLTKGLARDLVLKSAEGMGLKSNL
ncbi:hypothetical protein Tco_0570397 [Tanacetum coccineum]